MNIFIHQVHIKVKSQASAKPKSLLPIIDTTQEYLELAQLQGEIILKNPSYFMVHELLFYIIQHPETRLQKVYIWVEDAPAMAQKIKAEFVLLRAAGGIVQKNEQLLMIYRLGKWDLPKGKIEPQEKAKEAALREIAEETGVQARLQKKIAITWHFYQHNGQNILKQTKWYAMQCLDDSGLKPQTEESIEQILWLNATEAENLLAQSYLSIAFVLQKFLAKRNKKV